MNLERYAVPPDKLRWTCDPSRFTFKSTAEIPPIKGIVEQDRPVLLHNSLDRRYLGCGFESES